eukprot:1881700-Prymnesium_polylepis.2
MAGTHCAYFDANTNGGVMTFDHVPYAAVAIFQTITFDTWTEPMYAIMATVSPFCFIYSILIAVLGGARRHRPRGQTSPHALSSPNLPTRSWSPNLPTRSLEPEPPHTLFRALSSNPHSFPSPSAPTLALSLVLHISPRSSLAHLSRTPSHATRTTPHRTHTLRTHTPCHRTPPFAGLFVVNLFLAVIFDEFMTALDVEAAVDEEVMSL